MRALQAGHWRLRCASRWVRRDASSRYNDLNHRLMCTCGCAQILGECNHVGCPNFAGELAELRTASAGDKSDQQIFDSFVAKYGAMVLAAPTTHGFDLVAWIAPFAVFAAALLGTILLVRHWSVGRKMAARNSASTRRWTRTARADSPRNRRDGGY